MTQCANGTKRVEREAKPLAADNRPQVGVAGLERRARRPQARAPPVLLLGREPARRVARRQQAGLLEGLAIAATW